MIFSFVEKTSSRTHWTHRTLPAVKQAKKHRPQPWPRAISLASSCTQPQMQPENCRGNGGVVPTRILLRVFVNAILHLSSCKLEQFFVYFIVQTCNLYIYIRIFLYFNLLLANAATCVIFQGLTFQTHLSFFGELPPIFQLRKKIPGILPREKNRQKKKNNHVIGKMVVYTPWDGDPCNNQPILYTIYVVWGMYRIYIYIPIE